jgi:transposase-like protein
MSKARLIITAVVVERRSKSEVARDYDVSRQWVHQLVTRYRAEGEAAFEPRSRRPHTSPHAVSAAVEEEIVRLRKELSRQGLDAGADTIRTHLARSSARRTPRSKTSSCSASTTPGPDAVRRRHRRDLRTAAPSCADVSSHSCVTTGRPGPPQEDVGLEPFAPPEYLTGQRLRT